MQVILVDRLKELRAYLIKRFIYTIIIVGVAEFLLLKLLNILVTPILSQTYYGQAQYAGQLHFDDIILSLIMVIFGLLLQLIEFMLPGRMGATFSGPRVMLESRIQTAILGARSAHEYVQLSTHEKVIVLAFFIGMAVVIALPYILGATYFSVTVVRQFSKIEQAREDKEREYERKRNLMLSDIAHDLRTPMTTVSGYAKALSDGVVAEDKRPEYLDAIMRKSERMNDLIGLLFDYVRLGSEGFTLNKTDIDLCETVRECAAMQYQDIEDAGMELDVDIPEEKIVINADRLQFQRTITNLITNAIKHNNKGTKIGVYVITERNRVRIVVADSGSLIDQKTAEHIFEPFVMSDESRSSKGGSGLGLSIAAKVMDMHGYNLRLIQRPYIAKYNLSSEYVKMFMITIKM